jgi:hypothetical protein
MPESDPAIDPPAGYYQPVRGFGLFWREAYFGTIGFSAQERLGWATDEEFSLGELPVQCHADDGYAPRCYLMGPDDGPSGDRVVYAVRPDNSWWIWEGPTDVPAPVAADPILEPESPDCTSEEWADTVWPQLYEVQLTGTAAEGSIRVIGSGGYLYWGGKCGQRYDESDRSFRLTFDGEPAGSMGCYVNHCEATLSFPAHALLGTHVISVEGGSSITIQVTAR